jgi:parallel beta-helix repeat protein
VGTLNKKVIALIFLFLIISLGIILMQVLMPGPSESPTSPPGLPPSPTLSPTLPSSLYLDQYGIRGDGSDEGAALQAALNYARDNSLRTVVFPKDAIILTTSKITIHEGLNIVGNGCTIKLKENSGYPRDNQIMNLMDNARCSGLKLDGQWYTNPGVDGIRLFSGSVFDGNEVFNVGAYSVHTYNADNVTITNNSVHDGAQYGIATGGGDPDGISRNIVVSGNSIYNMQEVGIKIRGTEGSLISNNTVTVPSIPGLYVRGISLYSLDYGNANIRILNNTVMGEWGVGSGGGIVSDDARNTGIAIIGNRVGGLDVGIGLNFNNGTVTGNEVSDCRTACIVDNGNDNTVENNILTNCSMIFKI